MPKTVSKVCVFFNGIGVLVRRGLVGVDIVDDLLGTERTWQKLKPIIEGIKKQHNWPYYFKDFEYLYNEVKKRDRKLKKSKA